ncbi:hypothetical protein SAMN04489761_3605 [Tenacibaculum sp. MAR_2009_124]|uniref:hypothetical protein n=1 Tax=Tenacibaculum sp. MAR_2009_124 TaxID=1250059 RepID=UPI0008965703|nr:hypothetical protein [Tenacibaculum sp. MAR_2009_124]SEC79484.1 hypothetical protein SAMN04489761_3605 [Tenacibaculum sp. MAR_2009_124]
MLIILGTLVFILFIIGIICYKRQSKVREQIMKVANANNVPYQGLRNEINSIIAYNNLGHKI